MATRRIIAHYMHENEMQAALGRLSSAEDTGSYVIGDADDADLPALRQAGLIVEEVTPGPTLQDPGSEEAISGTRRAGMRPSRAETVPGFEESIAAAPSDSSFYYVQLRGPLLESWRERFEADGVTFLARYPNRVYKARLTTEQLQRLSAAGDAVEGIREIRAADTGPDVFVPHTAAPNAGVQMLTFDLRLHRAEDAPAVRAWLTQRHVVIAGSSERKLRVYLPEDSTLIDEIPALREVARFHEFVPPKISNDRARALIGIDRPNPGAALGLEGDGQIVAIADTGLDEAHPDLRNRIVGIVALGRRNDASDPNGHGTHVAGSVAGDGTASNGQIQGAAPKASIFFQSIMDATGRLGGLPVDLNDLFDEAYQNGARIHNNSWGAATRSMYTINSIEVDEFVDSHRDMLIVIAAGNEGVASGNVNAPPGSVDWLSVGSPASCKNALTVGASRSDRTTGGFSTLTWGEAWPANFPDPPIAGQTISGDPQSLAAFSSRGPCDDRRIKPDLVAPGTDIASTKSSSAPLANFWGPYPGNARYAFMGGTSMATPLVAGCAVLVREYFVKHAGHEPSAALLKATLINGTERLTGDDAVAERVGEPNYHQGYGCVNMRRSLPNASEPGLTLRFVDNWKTAADQFNATGQRRRYQFSVPAATASLRVTLAYTDRPARGLQNNLNLFLQLPDGTKRFGNADLPDTLNTPDGDNNVECIRIVSPAPGNYLIQISATNLLAGPQDFALVVTGEGISPLIPL